MLLLNAFEQATLEQLVSYQAKTEQDITRLLNNHSLQQSAKKLAASWNHKRQQLGLTPWE